MSTTTNVTASVKLSPAFEALTFPEVCSRLEALAPDEVPRLKAYISRYQLAGADKEELRRRAAFHKFTCPQCKGTGKYGKETDAKPCYSCLKSEPGKINVIRALERQDWILKAIDGLARHARGVDAARSNAQAAAVQAAHNGRRRYPLPPEAARIVEAAVPRPEETSRDTLEKLVGDLAMKLAEAMTRIATLETAAGILSDRIVAVEKAPAKPRKAPRKTQAAQTPPVEEPAPQEAPESPYDAGVQPTAPAGDACEGHGFTEEVMDIRKLF